jgi:hypothetical protein
MDTTLYKKVGRRYEPVSVYSEESSKSFPRGATLVVVDKYWTSRVYNIDPDKAAVLSAIELCRDELLSAITETSKLQPHTTALTEAQRKAWKAFEKEMGGAATLQGPSAYSILIALRDAVAKVSA